MPELDIKQWLKPEDVTEKGVLVTFVDEGEYRELEQKDGEVKTVFDITVALPNQETKTWTMNMKSQIAVATTYGKDTAKWVDKTAELFLVKQNVFGVIKDVIYASIPQKVGSAIDDVKAGLKKQGKKIR